MKRIATGPWPRQAILSFLEAWQETTPPSLKELQRSEEAPGVLRFELGSCLSR